MISFVIPTLNEEKIIENTLKVLSEYSGEKEIIISDGRSTDKTIEIAKKYTDKIIIHDGKTRQNIAMGRNSGGKIAKGEYIIFLDSDVVIPNINDFIKEALNAFEKNNKIVAQTVGLRVLKEMEMGADRFMFNLTNITNFFLNNVFRYGGASGEFQMIKKEFFDKTGGYNESMIAAEDHEFFIRLSKVGRTFYNRKLMVYHTGRRAHKIGWPKLFWQWEVNYFSYLIFKKTKSKEWEVIR